MKTRQAQEIVRRAKAIGYKFSHVTSGKDGRAASICSNQGGEYRKYFDYYDSAIEWLEMMEVMDDPEPLVNPV